MNANEALRTIEVGGMAIASAHLMSDFNEALAALRAVVEASPASPDIRPAGYNGPLSGPEVITGQPVSREWLRWQAGEIWSAKTIDDAVDTLADTLKGFGVNVEEEE